jgi:hypothetical protein
MTQSVFYIQHSPTGLYLSDPERDAWTDYGYGRQFYFTASRAEAERVRLGALHPEIDGYAGDLVIVEDAPPKPPK